MKKTATIIGDFFERIGGWIWHNKVRSLIIVVVCVGLLFFVLSPKKSNTNIISEIVSRGTLAATVSATGSVTSVTDLALSFSVSDVLRTLKVKVGDVVKKGDVLMTLDNRDEQASLTTAQGALQSAQAAYKKLVDGTSNEEITVAQVALDNAKSDLIRTEQEQQQLVDNAYRALLNSTPAAISTNSNSSSAITSPTISGTYTATQTGQYTISLYSSGSGSYFSSSGLETASGAASTSVVPLGTRGLFIQFPANFSVNANDSWIVEIPNKKASDYGANNNAYLAALETKTSAIRAAEALVSTREAELNLKLAKARPAELELAQADILSAKGKVDAAQVAYDNTILRAPADGTVTAVDVKIGELVKPQEVVATLQDTTNVYVEANINEANIAILKPGQKVALTFDALGPEITTDASIYEIEPAATITDGIVNYKIKVSVTDASLVKPGMTANLKIFAGEKADVVKIPKTAIKQNAAGKKVVQVITDENRNTTREQEVTTGFVGDNNQVEITSGLFGGERIVVLEK